MTVQLLVCLHTAKQISTLLLRPLPEMGAKHCDARVCMFVGLHISETKRLNLTKLLRAFVAVAQFLGGVAIRYVAYFRFCE